MGNVWSVRVDARSVEINAEEVRKALALLVDPDSHHELRGIPSGRSRTISGSNLDAAVRAVQDLADDKGVYITLNPVPADLSGACRDTKILCRKHILIDCDRSQAIKSRVGADSNATDAEKEAAKRVADAILRDLTDRGWPRPIMLDSGNGWHLVYAVDLPNDHLSKTMVKKALDTLQSLYGNDEVEVDTSVFNASRISKLPGTWVRKGSHTEQRPHRMARLVSVPAAYTAVPVEMIAELAGLAGKPEPIEPPADVWTLPVREAGQSKEAYVWRAIDAECSDLAAWPEGDRNNRLNLAAFRIGQLLHLGVARKDAERELEQAARSAGLSGIEVARTIRSGLEGGKQHPRTPEDKKERARIEAMAVVTSSDATPFVWASQILPKKVEWLWPHRIPIGKMTTFAGPGGIGKTFVLCDIAARVSSGSEWPLCGGETAEPGNVLFISGEDDEDDTLVPRLIECGANLDRIAFLSPQVHDQFTLAALELLSSLIDRITDVRLVVIDPPTTYLGDVDSHKDAELRGAILGPLKRWAAKYRVAVILNTHVNKASAPNVDAAARVMGSVAWVNAVRTAHMFIRDKDDPDKVLFVPFKVNITKRRPALSYKVAETRDELARIEWLGEIDTTADEALNKDVRKAGTRSAKEVLIEMFNERREWPGDLFWKHLEENDVPNRTAKDAKSHLGVPRARKTIGSNGDVVYVHWVPEDWPHLSR